MKAAITEGDGKIGMAEVPMPEAGPYQCLCKILACATCTGTDQKIISNKFPQKQKYPGILGHESVGRVINVGTRVRNIKEGDLFLRPTAVYSAGRLGDFYSLWGGFAEYGLVTDTQAIKEEEPETILHSYTKYQQKIPGDILISPAEATMFITLKEIASFLINLKITLNSSLVILGSGSVAMAACFFAKMFGAYPVIVIGRRDEPLLRMKKFGVDFTVNNEKEKMIDRVKELTKGKGVNFIIDAAGDQNLLADSLQILSVNGKIAPYAISDSFEYKLNRAKGPASWELCFTGPSEELTHQYLLDLKRMNMVPLDYFYSHRLPLSKIKEGFELLRKKEAFKIVFEIED